MTIAHGTRLGPYEILAPIGAGGMGEVYRARDPRLGRDVAIKVLPFAVRADADRLRRFEQEARAAAALNHPNILTVHEIGADNGTPYVVSELLEGQTLRSVLALGALPLRKAIEYGIEIAGGLAAAHEKGIVHRDLKPENLFVTADGRIKILDFGLAKLLEPSATAAARPTASTDTMPGAVLGTAGYMSPEQVRGEPVDARSDVFSLGAVLYEMATHRRAFDGKTPLHTLTAILDDDVPPSRAGGLPADRLSRLIRRCLEKQPQARFQSARDLAFALSEELIDAPGGAVSGARISPLRILAALTAVLVGGAVTVWFGARSIGSSDPPPVSTLRLTVQAALPAPYTPDQSGGIAVSRDGAALAFTGRRNEAQSLFVRRFDRFTADEVVGSTNAAGPFFSPDGEWLAFQSGSALKKVPVTGGTPVEICRLPAPLRGGTWAADGTIFFGLSTASGIQQVSADGGEAKAITEPSGPASFHRWPSALPDGRGLLYTDWGASGRLEQGTILVKPPHGEPRIVVRGGSAARYVRSGHVVFVGAGGLMAVLFDLQSLQPLEAAFALGESILTTPLGGAAYDVSDNGTLVSALPLGSDQSTSLVWLDRNGRETGTRAPRAPYEAVRLSPDGSKAALQVAGPTARNIWTYDFKTGISSRLTFDTGAAHAEPVWSPDGTRIAYRKAQPAAGTAHVSVIRADGQGAEEQLMVPGADHYMPNSWSRDGRILVLEGLSGRFDILRLDVPRTRTQLLAAGAPRQTPRLSPDGQWLAYASAESGRNEIVVQPFPSMDGRWQVSVNGGVAPLWRRDGRALFYLSDGKLMEVDISTHGGFSAGQPRVLFEGRYRASYDVTPDGQRFLMMPMPESAESPRQFNVTINWLAALQRQTRAPIGR